MYQRVNTAVDQFVPERYQHLTKQFIKFGVTGAIGAIVDFTTYNFLTRALNWGVTITFFGYPLIAANMVSVFLAIVSNFILNKYWTFRDPSRQVARQWTGYFILNVLTFSLNQILTSFFTFRVPLFLDLFGDQRDNAAKAVAIGIILFVNFLGSKFLVFKPKVTTRLAASE